MAKLLSGKVGVTSYAGLSTTRQQTTGFPGFLGLEEAEPNLGLPGNNDHVLYGNVDGKRYWGVPSGAPSGTASGLTVEDEGVAPSGYGGSVTRFNFVGNGIQAIQTKQTFGGVTVGVATVLVNKSTNDIQDANAFTRITGVTTFRVGAGLSFVEVPAGEFSSGIVSIFSQADALIDFQDERGFASYQNLGIIRVGAGLTITNPVAGVGSISPNGSFNHIDQIVGKHISLTGASTATAGYFGNLTGNVTGNVTGNLLAATTDSKNVRPDTDSSYTLGTVTHRWSKIWTDDIEAGGTITGALTGNVNGTFNQNPASGVSTIGQLRVDTVYATGIVTTTKGYIAPGGSFGFVGNFNATGVSTAAYLKTTQLSISGVTTASGGVVGNVNGAINQASSGISTLGQLQLTTANASGIVTATGGFVGNVTGNIIGNVTGAASQIAVTDESTVSNCNVIYASGGPTGNLQPRSGTNLTFNSSNGTLFATKFSGDGSLLTSIPASQLTGTVAVGVDGSNLTNLNAATVALTATNTTDAGHFVTFVDTATGSENVRTDTDFIYNPGTNTLTVGAISGNATGLTGNPNITVGNILPAADDTHDIGSSTLRFKNVHSMDLHLNNEGSSNSVDGTWGNWTLQEGEKDLFLLNNRSGKRYKFNLTEV